MIRRPPRSTLFPTRRSSDLVGVLFLMRIQDKLGGLAGGRIRQDLGAGDAIEHQKRHVRSEEHTSELQSLRHLVCRLLLEKKKANKRRSYVWLLPIQT